MINIIITQLNLSQIKIAIDYNKIGNKMSTNIQFNIQSKWDVCSHNIIASLYYYYNITIK